jgi:hypothetical protein
VLGALLWAAPAFAQDRISFATNWLAEAEHVGAFREKWSSLL